MATIIVGDKIIISTFVTVAGIPKNGQAYLINTESKVENNSNFNKNPSWFSITVRGTHNLVGDIPNNN
ncbi:hypothetical protein [Dolichospermum sp. UHCC 0259]|uniref:hypothetical protein n=1 Tax=Dolichospermum sp. UHCC 0259 TaxID=2590010 RepID=UPI001445C7CC